MWTDLMCIKKESHRDRSLQVENLWNLSCRATKCLDARRVCSIDVFIWSGGEWWDLCVICVANTLYFSDNLSEGSPKTEVSPFFSVILEIVLISCFRLSMLGDFSACVNSVQMLWKIFPLLFLFNQGTVFFPRGP